MTDKRHHLCVWGIVVSYQGSPWIRQCLESIRDSTYPVEIIVVDNGSTDGTRSIVEQFRDIRCIRQETNIGFGRANNIGMRQALDAGADYVFLLNQDALVQPQTVERLVSCAEQNPQFGVLSPLHLNGDGTTIDARFTRYIARDAPGYFSDLRLSEPKPIYAMRFANAAAWLISRRSLDEVGGFDPLFFMYCEDNDYCNRVQLHGLGLGLVPSAEIYHAREKSPVEFESAWERRWVNLANLSQRVKSRQILKLKEPSHPFRLALVDMTVDLCADMLRATCRWRFHWVLVNIVGLLRVIVTLPRIWRHRKVSATAGAHWL